MQFIEAFEADKEGAVQTSTALHDIALGPAGYNPEDAKWKEVSRRVAEELNKVRN